MKKLVIGILAHVDAGKTTLSEGMLYLTGKIRNLGRVDHRNTYLDTHEIERERGITIFSKQAVFSTGDMEVILMDTPGHVDFSTEMERTLQILDYAILVISGTDGVQAHTETLWRLLKRYDVPTFLFVTKMDLAAKSRAELMEDIRTHLDETCMDFGAGFDDAFYEEVAVQDETLLEKYLDSGSLDSDDIAGLVGKRKLYPCYFGSGLKLDGVEEFLCGLSDYTVQPKYADEFGAKVYKISRDLQGNRMTCMKITGGVLKVRDSIVYRANGKDENIEEKITQIREYSGAKYTAPEFAEAGSVCAVLGLNDTWPGQGLGAEPDSGVPVLEPVLNYRIALPPDCDARTMLPKLQQLQEEDPQLHIAWDERLREIHAGLMGSVQTEVLKQMVKERFDVDVTVDSGRIMYRETIAEPVVGVGHFEPLRHYAEVHLLMEPLKQGSGLVFGSRCSEDVLDRNWQRLIMTHLEEKQHIGVLTGSPITDMRISLIAGRAHIKHTEGGDFRQATYRAIRHGLMKAKSVLLEPYYEFRLEVPAEYAGRAISDIQGMHGDFEPPMSLGENMLITGSAPVSTMRSYVTDVAAYTHGRGRFTCSVKGYDICHNADSVAEVIAYSPESDLENTADSVFCAHGGGFNVKWDKVEDYMHLDSGVHLGGDTPNVDEPKLVARNMSIDDKELEAIMLREFGPVKSRLYRPVSPEKSSLDYGPYILKKEYIIVDGYNLMFAWDELKSLADANLDAARDALMDILANYKGFKNCELVLVFDAYNVKNNSNRERFDHHGIHVVYTKENETGDNYIEKLTEEIGKNYAVRVVTSDNMIQLTALRSGVLRVSAREFKLEVESVNKSISEIIDRINKKMVGNSGTIKIVKKS